MKKIYNLMILLGIMIFAINMQAQKVTVSGKVTDDKGEPVVGASIVSLSPGQDFNGTATDLNGMYSLTIDQAMPVTLKVSFVGYSTVNKTVENAIGGKAVLDFVLSIDALGLDEVVVTGVVNRGTKLSSSVSITTLKLNQIEQSAPRTTAEIFRTIPGVRSEASGGEGNTNITVRGVPISAGGSKYLQLQEDGLPVFLYGDIAFATADIFLRADQNLARIEAIRGGSASTLASNSPAGIINFISKTGEQEEGSIATTFGLDYGVMRTDFEYGSPLSNGVNFHIGGFFRSGQGVRTTGYNDNVGGQIKANLTKKFKNGFARVYFKYLNDKTSAYMPMPVQVSGTNDNPEWTSIEGFSANLGSTHSIYLQSDYGIGSNGERRRVDIADGMHPVSMGTGAEFNFELGNGWSISSKSRYTTNSGRFVAPFTANVGSTADMIKVVGTSVNRDLTGAKLTYAHDGKAFGGNLAQVLTLFDTELDNFNNLFSDTKVTKELGNLKLSAGLFKAYQNINMSWLWNNYLTEVKGENAGLLDVTMADGTKISESGQFSYGVSVWGNCCQVQYDSKYDVTAPYFSASYSAGNLDIDGSMRYDLGYVRGVGFGGSQAAIDVNNNGKIDPIENSVSTINHADKNPVNYDYDYLSYSLGANYKLNETSAVFARYSRGGSAKADRAIFPSGTYLSMGNPKDMIDQAELGYKSKFSNGGLYATAFYAKTTEEGGFEATTQKVIENDYNAMGLELEGAFNFGALDLRGALTYTAAKISSGDNEGNTPRRQPALMFNLIPSYTFGKHAIGLSFIGQTKAFAQDNNQLVMPGYFIANAFVNVGITDGLSLTLNGNNLLNATGFTESEEGAITDNQVNYIRARSILGRSLSATIRYNF